MLKEAEVDQPDLEPVDRAALHAEMEQARADLHRLLAAASTQDLRRGTRGTRWTNGQLLYHIVFGYMIVRTLLPLVRAMSRAPNVVSRGFAALLNAGTRPFHVVNYLGTCGGALVFPGRRATVLLDRTVAALHRNLDAEPEATLHRGMHFPPGWDPYFGEVMTVADVYHYGTQHFEHHRQQLTLGRP
jgi:DinB family protein